MKRQMIIMLATMMSLAAFAQDYEALGKYMEKYSSCWNRLNGAGASGGGNIKQEGTPMPEYNFSKTLNSRSLRGKTVVMTFWATWCGGCRLLCVDLDSVMVRHSDEYRNVQIIGVDANEKLVDKGYVPSTFWQEKGIGYPTTKPGKAADQCAESIKAGHPSTIVIDGEGIIRGRWDAWSPGVAGDVALAAWVIDVAPRQGIKADLPTVDRLIDEGHYDRALYLLEQMPLDTLSIAQRWKAMLEVSGRKAMELYGELKKAHYDIKDDMQAWNHRPSADYVVMMRALRDVIYESNSTDPDILQMGREAASVAANWDRRGTSNSFKGSELTLRYARAVYRRAASALVSTMQYARKDNDQSKMAALQALFDKYGIAEAEYAENNRDHRRMEQDMKEQQEHMNKKR